MASRLGKWLAVPLVAVALVVASATAGTAAVVDQTYHVWAWNVAGWTMHRGSTTNGMVSAAAGSVSNRNPDFVAFNEICWSQYRAIQDRLRAAGWPQDTDNFSRFEPSLDTVCNGQPFGNAIFSRAPLGTAFRQTLPQDERTERRTLLCAPLAARPHMRFCTTHITTSNTVINGRKINEQQLDAVRSRLENFHAAGDTVLIAGDFNAQPNYGRLNNWYSPSLNVPNNPNNTGFYRELDDTDGVCVGYGETTVAAANTASPCGTGSKIDLIFARESQLAGTYSGDSLSPSTACGGLCSDHRIILGTATVRVTS